MRFDVPSTAFTHSRIRSFTHYPYLPPMSQPPQLRKALTSIHLWAIAVGLVISGEYFGWNYGWGVAGTVGFLIATLAVTLMYVTFIFSFTELTTSIPHAGGPFAYSYKAFGPIGGLIAGYATVIRSEEHTSELQSRENLVCRLLL